MTVFHHDDNNLLVTQPLSPMSNSSYTLSNLGWSNVGVFSELVTHFCSDMKEKSLLNSQQHNRATRYSNINFICPRFNRLTEGGRSFAVTTCQLWNSLSLELRNSVSLESFRNNFRKNLFAVQRKLHHFIV